MRFRETQNGLEITAVCGTSATLLSFDMDQNQVSGLLGFSIEREDLTEGEKYFLKGFKYFEASDVQVGQGQLFSSFEQPIQSFMWEDFSSKPEHDYIYNVSPVYGNPKNLIHEAGCSIRVKTPSNHSGVHSVYFNRGVAGSNAYASKFKNQRPDEMLEPEKTRAMDWLSKGLDKALLGFIASATDSSFKLRASVYEFEYEPVLLAFKEAFQTRKVDVHIVYDARGAKTDNENSITKAGLPTEILTPRTKNAGFISHNKFIVLMQAETPIAVWTGSTNITAKGIFGQCNTGHIVRDEKVAQHYYDYWKVLNTDPDMALITKTTTNIQPDLKAAQLPAGISTFFSPRPVNDILRTYADFIKDSQQMVCGMFPFSFSQFMKDEIVKPTEHLKYIVIDKKDKNTTLITTDVDNVIVYAGAFKTPLYDWLLETNAGSIFNKAGNDNIGTNFIHNKVILIDPLSESPVILSGSANFSNNSIIHNDENTLAIKGDKDLADVYFTEFVRIFNHYYVRQITKALATPTSVNPLHLKTNSDEWTPAFYKNSALKCKRKLMFKDMVVSNGV